MRFRELPVRLRLFILAHLAALAPLVLTLYHTQPPLHHGLLVTVLLGFTLIFSVWKVELTVFQGRMTPTFAVVCLALLLPGAGGYAALLCAVVGAVVSTCVRAADCGWRVVWLRPALYRLFFNAANCAVACGVSVLVFEGVRMLAPAGVPGAILAVMAFTASYFIFNTLGVALAVSYQQRLGWLSVWHQNFLWTAPGFFASASAAVGIQALYRWVDLWSLMFLPPLYLVYYSYRLYMDRIHLFADKVQQDMSHIQALNELNKAIIASLATAIDAKDRYTCSHINRVQKYALALARAAGLEGPDLEAVATGALVHDIGKLGIPDHILGKPGKLTSDEFRRIQSHVTIGVEILSPIPFPFPVVDVVHSHHERWDGQGYPRGLKAEEIPIGGRIISIVDVYDALTSNRPYRRAMTVEQAVRTLREGAGKHFDPRLVELFEQVLPQVSAEIRDAEEAEVSAEVIETVEGTSALVQISQAAAEMAAVCDVAHALAEQESLDAISTVVVDRALALLPGDTAVLYLTLPSGGELVAHAVQGHYQEKLHGMTIQVGEGAAGWVARHQQARVNVAAALDVARRFTPEENMELSSATAVPLVHGPESLGVLAVYTLGYNILSEHHLNVLNILAEHAAAAIQNSRRVERHREMAFSDALTGLANSRGLVRHMERLLRSGGRQGENGFSVVMLDLDRFKDVNDTFGHLRGDDLLREVAERLTIVSRPGDVVCRYAGDEFVLLLCDVEPLQAERIADRVREAIDEIPAVQGRVKVGASVGVASFPLDGLDGRTLINVADRRMYEDKFQRRRTAELADHARREAELIGVG